MEKKIAVTCECKGTGFIAVADSGGDGIENVECGQHHPAFQDAPSVNELSWFRLSEQTLRVDKWSPAGVRLPNGAAAG
jgi:hypothetical protein